MSIIIVFSNDYPSMLKRTLHSIYNRTPHSLLQEIILINDNSTHPELFEPLVDYSLANFGDIIKFRVSNESRGVQAKIDGVRMAKGEVVVSIN